jgi:hypothetical protein
MIAGSDIAKGAASSLTETPGSCASRITSARRVASDSAAKVRSRGASENFTIWLSIGGMAALSIPARGLFRGPLANGQNVAGANAAKDWRSPRARA